MLLNALRIRLQQSALHELFNHLAVTTTNHIVHNLIVSNVPRSSRVVDTKPRTVAQERVHAQPTKRPCRAAGRQRVVGPST